MMARMFKPPKSAPRPAENKAVHAKERKTRRNPACGFAGSHEKGRSVKFPSDGKSLSEGFYLEVSCWP